MLACLFLSGCGANSLPPAALSQCRVDHVADLPLYLHDNLLRVPVTIDGHDGVMELDTGAGRTLISRTFATSMHLQADPHHWSAEFDMGGMSQRQPDVLVGQITFGGRTVTPTHLPVIDMVQRSDGGAPFAGYLGADLLQQFDLDIDVQMSRLTLWQVSGCRGDFLPWHDGRTSLPVDRSSFGWLIVHPRINGHTVAAIFDTGATWDAVRQDTAKRVGVRADRFKRRIHPDGVFSRALDLRVGWATEIDIGRLRRTNQPVAVIAKSVPGVQMLIGLPVMHQHRVWISYATKQIFLSSDPTTRTALTDH